MSNGWVVAGILWVLGGAITAGAVDAGAQRLCNGQPLKNVEKVRAFIGWPIIAGLLVIRAEPGPFDCNLTIDK